MLLGDQQIMAARLVACLALLAVTSAPSASAQAESIRTPFAFEAFNPCTGEFIFFEGRIHSVTRGEPTEPHGIHFSVQALGVTAAGVNYGWHSIGNTQTTFPEGAPGDPPPPDRPAADTETSGSKVLIIRQGSEFPEDDNVFRAFSHITVNANGEVTSVRLTFSDECQ
jgi:hypothetical protein